VSSFPTWAKVRARVTLELSITTEVAPVRQPLPVAHCLKLEAVDIIVYVYSTVD